MNLVVLTEHYPYGVGEEFFENELRIAEVLFDKIIIVTAQKGKEKITKYIPANAEIIRSRDYKYEVVRLVKAMRFLLSFSTWKELKSVVSERDSHSILQYLKIIIQSEDEISYIKKSEKRWKKLISNNKTIFYSYWLSAGATYLSRNRHKFNGLFISRAHGSDCFYDRGYIPFRKSQLIGLDKIFPVSDQGRKDIISHYSNMVPDIEKKVEVSRLGVATFLFDNKNVLSDRYTIATCSSIIELKRLDLLIKALAQIEDIRISWHHFGDGTGKDSIEQLAHSYLDNKNNIDYVFHGHVANDDVIEYYKNNHINLFVNCSDVEGIPVSVMEAMSFGIPVIARDVGGNKEIVDNNCGVLLPKNIDSEELKSAIELILTLEAGKCQEYRKNAFDKVYQIYNREQNYKSFYSTLISLLDNNS